MRILLDCDTGIDDALAILYLAAQPDAEIVAAGTVHGNVPPELGADNTMRVFTLAGITAPVAVGAGRPLAQPLHTSEYVHGGDGLGDAATDLPMPQYGPRPEPAAMQLVRLARAHPGELTLLAIGPLTNVALALLLEPALPRLLHRVVVMGGAVAHPGNITPYAEANIWHDPEAAELVLGAGFALTLVGLDVTMRALVDTDWLARLAASDSPGARFATRILGHYVDFYSTSLGTRTCSMHDPLAAAVALDPGLATRRETPVHVELRGAHSRGATLADLRPGDLSEQPSVDPRPPVHVLTDADIPAFTDRLLTALTQKPG